MQDAKYYMNIARKTKSDKPSLPNYTPFEFDYVQGIYFEKDENLVICFRESDENKDWVSNFKFLKRHPDYFPKGVRIHNGFRRAYELTREHIIEITNGYKNIIFCGFSMGGALSLIAAADMKNNFQKNVSVWCYGTPMVGNKNFVSLLNGVEIMRYVYGNDWVVKSLSIIPGYKQPTERISFGPEWKWWKISFKDHNPKTYDENIILLGSIEA